MIPEEEIKRPAEEQLQRLLRKIQNLPDAKMTSEEENEKEIAEYRAGR